MKKHSLRSQGKESPGGGSTMMVNLQLPGLGGKPVLNRGLTHFPEGHICQVS